MCALAYVPQCILCAHVENIDTYGYVQSDAGGHVRGALKGGSFFFHKRDAKWG